MQNEDNENKTADFKNIVTKKDLVYTILFLSIIIILMFSSKNSSNPNLVAYIGFAGTITSILLGVIAIIYSFFQSYDNSLTKDSLSKQLKKLNLVANTLKDEIDSIVGIKNIIEEVKNEVVDLQNSMTSFQKSLDSIENSVLKLDKETWREESSEKTNKIKLNYGHNIGINSRSNNNIGGSSSNNIISSSSIV